MTKEPVKTAVMEMRDVEVAALRDPSVIVLEQVNWTVLENEFWVVAGPQQSGKSDLLALGAALMNPAAGTFRLFGREVQEFNETDAVERQRIGFMFGDGKLFNQMTIAENIALPLQYHKDLGDSESARDIESLVELLELTHCAKMMPGQVAAVWRQRAALARALVLRPQLLLLDNPNAGLIERHRRWLVNFLNQLWRGHEFFGNRPMTIVACTDDLRAWEDPGRKFAALYEGRFTLLGLWGSDNFARHRGVRELLVLPEEVDATAPKRAT
jgi:ABC-type transporter Mla maintaining outer membrane lipid asymmetry ATPase subunit MlaF